MTTPSADALYLAFQLKDGKDSVHRIKDVVADALRNADRSVRIVQTSHFNHSYVPDMVLSGQSGERMTLAKFSFARPAIRARIELDVTEHATEHPMFIQLSTFDRESGGHGDVPEADDPYASLEASARSARSLVTEVSALDELVVGDSPATQLLPPSILRGGIGVLEQDEARSAASIVNAGFNGALEAYREPTAEALNVISEVLDPSAATELSGFLETMWIASGGSVSEFPGAFQDLGVHISSRRLQAILDAIDGDRVKFWQKIGESVQLDSFDQLNLVGEAPALQAMMTTALPRLSAKTCRIAAIGDPSDSTRRFRWQVNQGTLAIEGFGRQAWVAEHKERLPRADDEQPAPPVPTLLAKRARAAGAAIGRVELVGVDRSVSYQAAGGVDLASDDLVGPSVRLSVQTPE